MMGERDERGERGELWVAVRVVGVDLTLLVLRLWSKNARKRKEREGSGPWKSVLSSGRTSPLLISCLNVGLARLSLLDVVISIIVHLLEPRAPQSLPNRLSITPTLTPWLLRLGPCGPVSRPGDRPQLTSSPGVESLSILTSALLHLPPLSLLCRQGGKADRSRDRSLNTAYPSLAAFQSPPLPSPFRSHSTSLSNISNTPHPLWAMPFLSNRERALPDRPHDEEQPKTTTNARVPCSAFDSPSPTRGDALSRRSASRSIDATPVRAGANQRTRSWMVANLKFLRLQPQPLVDAQPPPSPPGTPPRPPRSPAMPPRPRRALAPSAVLKKGGRIHATEFDGTRAGETGRELKGARKQTGQSSTRPFEVLES